MLLSEWRSNHQLRIFRICKWVYFKGGCWSARKLGIECEDFQQNILIELYLKDDQVLVSPQRFTETIATRRKLDMIRKASRTNVSYSGLFDSETFSDVFLARFDSSIAEVELSDRIERLARKLDDKDAKVLLLRFTQSLSREEIAQQLSISLSSVKRALARIRELAPDLLSQDGDDLSLDA